MCSEHFQRGYDSGSPYEKILKIYFGCGSIGHKINSCMWEVHAFKDKKNPSLDSVTWMLVKDKHKTHWIKTHAATKATSN